MKLVRGVPLLLERHVHVRGYVSVPLYKHKTNSMVQTIATLIDETLMVMGAHLHVRMTDEEKAYLDAHFELIHIKRRTPRHQGRGSILPLLSGIRHRPVMVSGQRE